MVDDFFPPELDYSSFLLPGETIDSVDIKQRLSNYLIKGKAKEVILIPPMVTKSIPLPNQKGHSQKSVKTNYSSDEDSNDEPYSKKAKSDRPSKSRLTNGVLPSDDIEEYQKLERRYVLSGVVLSACR